MDLIQWKVLHARLRHTIVDLARGEAQGDVWFQYSSGREWFWRGLWLREGSIVTRVQHTHKDLLFTPLPIQVCYCAFGPFMQPNEYLKLNCLIKVPSEVWIAMEEYR